MIVSHNRFNKWLELFNKKYNLDISVNDLKKDSIITTKHYKRFKNHCYYLAVFNCIETLNLIDCNTFYNSINLVKLDSKLFNILREKEGFNVHDLSLNEKCKKVFTGKEYKIIVKYLSMK